MITKQQLLSMNGWGELHCTTRRDCHRVVGPRGGVKTFVDVVRLSGKCQTWVTRPAEFKQPVKYGMYESFYITEDNCSDFHLAVDCPLHDAECPKCSHFHAKGTECRD